MLGCIGVLNQKRSGVPRFAGIYRVVCRIARKQSAISGVSGRIGPPQDRPDKRMINGSTAQLSGLKIRVDRKSTEREVAQDHPSMYLPSSEPRDGFSDAVEIALDRADALFVAIFKREEFAVKSYIGFEKFLKAEVDSAEPSLADNEYAFLPYCFFTSTVTGRSNNGAKAFLSDASDSYHSRKPNERTGLKYPFPVPQASSRRLFCPLTDRARPET